MQPRRLSGAFAAQLKWRLRSAHTSARHSFHGLRCEAGWLTGVGAVTSAEFTKACLRAGTTDVAVATLARGPLVGLTVSPDVCCRVLAATAAQVRRCAAAARSCRPAV